MLESTTTAVVAVAALLSVVSDGAGLLEKGSVYEVFGGVLHEVPGGGFSTDK